MSTDSGILCQTDIKKSSHHVAVPRGMSYSTNLISFNSLYSIIDIHVFLVIIPFGCTYEFIYFGRLVLRHRSFCWLHSHFPLSPRYMRHCTRMFFAIFIQIITEWLWSYSSYSPIPPMTQFGTQSTSLLIFWTFILMHSFAICYFCPLLFLPIILMHSIAILFLLFSNQRYEYQWQWRSDCWVRHCPLCCFFL